MKHSTEYTSNSTQLSHVPHATLRLFAFFSPLFYLNIWFVSRNAVTLQRDYQVYTAKHETNTLFHRFLGGVLLPAAGSRYERLTGDKFYQK